MVNQSASGLARTIMQSASGSLALRLTALGLGFVSNILLARLMGTSGYGAYAYLLAWVNFLYVPAMLGTDKLLIREVAIFNSQEQWAMMRGIVSWCGRWVLLSALLLSILMIGTASLIDTGLGEMSIQTLVIASCLIPLLALTGLRQSVLRGLGAVVRGQLPESIIRPALLILAISIWALVSAGELELFDAMTMNIVAAAAAFLVGAIILKQRFPQQCFNVSGKTSGRMWILWSLPLLLLGFSQAGSGQLPMLVLGYVGSEHELGLFAAASRVALLGNFFLMALNAAFAPRIAALHAAGRRAELQYLVSITSLWVTVLSVVPLLIFVFAGQEVLSIFGADFEEADKILAILAFGVFINASMGSVGLLLTMTRNVRPALYGALTALTLNIAFSAILIPRYGAIGAAWASAIVLVAANLVYGFFVYKRIGIIPSFAALAIPNRTK